MVLSRTNLSARTVKSTQAAVCHTKPSEQLIIFGVARIPFDRLQSRSLPASTSPCPSSNFSRVATRSKTKMVQYWRAAGMTYLTYSIKCADLVRQALKEPIRSQVLGRAGFSMTKGNWEGGKIVQRSTSLTIVSLSILAASLLVRETI